MLLIEGASKYICSRAIRGTPRSDQSSYLSRISRIIFVEKKYVNWRNFSFPYMTIMGKLRISPHVEKFGKIWEILRNLGKFCHNFRTFMWRKIEPISTFVEKNDKYKVCGIVWKIICTYAIIAKDCLLTLIKSRLALGTLGCSVGRHHAKNGPIHRKMVVDCVQVITSKVKLFFRPEKRNEWSSQSFA